MKDGLTDIDLHLWGEGKHWRAWERFGAHAATSDGRKGTRFAVWAPAAKSVSVIGDFNAWTEDENPLERVNDSGVWQGFVEGVGHGQLYKYAIRSRLHGYHVAKSDPFGFSFELRPQTASVVWDLSGYEWQDQTWVAQRAERNALDAPHSVYEVHLGSWKRKADGGFLTYAELAEDLADYCEETGFTHVELLPISEHPFDGSWGYQPIGYYAPTRRFGTPQEFMHFVDILHRRGVGVILDWVPGHFPKDEHGLSFFDGTHLYEHADPRKGVQQDWDTLIFNFDRNQVRNFLLANALFWLEMFHIDGLRVDAVASMLYLDYSRDEGEWIPNRYGGRENLEAIEFLKEFNTIVYEKHPDTMTIAEESTAWPMVSRPTYLGGLGFGLKWNMGWMHDSLEYISKDPIHRGFHHHQMTFGLLYAFHENFVLPYSHDEVVHGKRSMLNKMPGDEWRKRANLRLLYGWMWAHPGKKLLFMGCEFGQWREWNHESELDWQLLETDEHRGIKLWVGDLNRLLRNEPALHEQDFESEGFEWIDCQDNRNNVLSFVRWDTERLRPVVCVYNFTPVPRSEYRVGVPLAGAWRQRLNSDAHVYGGSGMGNNIKLETTEETAHGYDQSLELELPPLAAVILTPEPATRKS